jgi:pilus assembly protein TadC
MSPALVLAAIGLLLARPRSAAVPRVLRRPGTIERIWLAGHAPTDQAGRLGRRVTARATAGAFGLAVALFLGGVLGIAAGAVAAGALVRLLPRLETASGRRRREERAAELPLTLDLLSVCLQAGMPLVAALETVADALPGPFTDDLRVVAGLQRLGAAPAAAWEELAGDPDLAPIGRAVARSAESGSRLAATFDRLAADRRAALAAAGVSRARTAGVLAMAPLGLCFLPAFVCLGILPIVLSLTREVLPS